MADLTDRDYRMVRRVVNNMLYANADRDTCDWWLINKRIFEDRHPELMKAINEFVSAHGALQISLADIPDPDANWI